jgi:uncharacterized protein
MKLLLKDNRRYFLRFDIGEELVKSLQDFLISEKISSASLQGIGSCSEVVLGFYNSKSKEYEKTVLKEDLEVVSLLGNVSVMENRPATHIHGVFSGKDFASKSGHVFSLVVSATCEIFLINLEGELNRGLNSEFNLNLLK